MTDEQKAKAFDKIIEAKELQKKKDRFYWDRQKHIASEMKRVIHENKLEDQMVEFEKTIEDYIS